MARRASSLSPPLPAELAAEFGTGSAGANTALVAALPPDQRAVTVQAYTDSLSRMWIFYTVLAVVGLVGSLAIGRQKLSKTHEVTRTGLDGMEEGRRERKEAERQKREVFGKSLEGEKAVNGGDGRGQVAGGGNGNAVNGDRRVLETKEMDI